MSQLRAKLERRRSLNDTAKLVTGESASNPFDDSSTIAQPKIRQMSWFQKAKAKAAHARKVGVFENSSEYADAGEEADTQEPSKIPLCDEDGALSVASFLDATETSSKQKPDNFIGKSNILTDDDVSAIDKSRVDNNLSSLCDRQKQEVEPLAQSEKEDYIDHMDQSADLTLFSSANHDTFDIVLERRNTGTTDERSVRLLSQTSKQQSGHWNDILEPTNPYLNDVSCFETVADALEKSFVGITDTSLILTEKYRETTDEHDNESSDNILVDSEDAVQLDLQVS